MMFYDISGQKMRFSRVITRFTEFGRNRIESDGRFGGYFTNQQNKSGYYAEGRDVFWLAQGFFASSETDWSIANKLIETVQLRECHFVPMIVAQILAVHENKLTDSNTIKLKSYLSDNIEFLTDVENEFVGVNDNFPCMSALASIVGGKLINDGRLTQYGINNIEQCVKMLKRRGTLSEFNSPTYTPVQLVSIAGLADLAEDEYVREMALYIERRIWIDILGHLGDHGRKIGLSVDNNAIVAYRPMKYIGMMEVESLRLSIIISRKGTRMRNLVVNGKELDDMGTYSFPHPSPVFVNDGGIYMGIFPFGMERDSEMKIEGIEDELIISIYDYKGTKKAFGRQEILDINNGFSFTIDCGMDFRKFVDEPFIIKEQIYSTSHSRGTKLKHIMFERNKAKIEMVYDVENLGVQYSMINDKRIEKPYLSSDDFDLITVT